ncbi:RHS repeat-associated core domain-containing protein [Pseudomonas muyukensis]|uniref:RHS repeat-associated core domain-containing protein n=1 Tax=Pseudomonas muyukensis TaxID=2842357 RepID=A0ABX8MCE2_9PSED|nr:RHS repeat-associated core domain-containing protein [Pseudomonas muyukensis]QXH36754.1 hypothetical protein KSS95_08010 [Pseudomonas muyukensis]
MTAIPIEIGRQTFDGLGRQRSVSVTGRTTHYHYQPGQLPPTANTLPDGSRVAYSYEPQLGNALLGIQVDGNPGERLSYHPHLGRPIQATGRHSEHAWHFTPSGQLQRDSWTVDGQVHSTHWRHSLLGQLLGFTDAAGTQHTREHDAFGRIHRVQAGEVRTTISYDAFSRPAMVISEDLASARTLSKHLEYDSFGREARCTFNVSEAGQSHAFVQTLAYSNLDQLISRTWEQDGAITEEHFAYDLRGRLVHYSANAHAGPQDPFGNTLVEQRFAFNHLDGLREVISTFTDGSTDTATFRYAETDPTQVIAIGHTHHSWPAEITLTYDACGQVVGDSLGRQLTWNDQGRLASVSLQGSTCHYRYTPSGQLCDRVVDGNLTRGFHSGTQLTHEERPGERLELAGDGTTLFAANRVAGGVRQTTLLGCDTQGSVRLEAGAHLSSRHYSPHGAETGQPGHSRFGFCGQRREPLTGWIIPAGYRPYDPVLMCFLAPDSESPFGRGGINPYAYCGGDPINRSDPDGHSWQTWVMAGVGIAAGILASVASLGTAGAALGAILAGGTMSASGVLAVATAALNTLSVGTGIASMVLQAQGADEKAASVLGWVSLGTGAASLIGAASSLGSRSLAHYAKGATQPQGGTAVRAISKPTHWIKRSAVLYAKSSEADDVVWHTNLWGKNIRAFETHGSPTGHLLNAQGQVEAAAQLALREIAPRLTDLPADVPFVLLACHGGKSGAAQQIANVLQRPVYGYDHAIFVKRAQWMQHLWVDDAGTSIPTQVAASSRLQGPLPAGRELAAGRLYFPRK